MKERLSVSEDEKVLFLDRLLKISEENSDFTMEDVRGEGNTAIMAVSYTICTLDKLIVILRLGVRYIDGIVSNGSIHASYAS